MLVCPICDSAPTPVVPYRSDKSGGMDCECRRLSYYMYHGPGSWSWVLHVNDRAWDFPAINSYGDGSLPSVLFRSSLTARKLLSRPLEGGFPGEFRDVIRRLRNDWLTSKVMGC